MSVNGKRSSLLMIELISAILIFAVCCAICVGLFAEAGRESKNSARLTRAVFLAQNAAELMNGDYDRNLQAVLGAKAAGNVYTAGFDQDWQPVSGAGRYGLVVTVDAQNGVACILVTDNGTGIYQIQTGLIDLDGGKT